MANHNADTLQSVIGDDLFPTVHHISDVKQVLEEMTEHAQELQEGQIRAILFLTELGKNEYLHEGKSPYKDTIEYIMKGKKLVANPSYFLDTIEGLIPKPPKPIIMAEKGQMKGGR